MRLINTKTLKLEEFFGGQTPKYAILSHRWGDEEISLEQYQNGEYDPQQEGYRKFEGFCSQVNKSSVDSISYGWYDSFCIDKRNNTELSESLNSMFKWYQDADACYVHLSDLRESLWLTRGWTLQELVAARNVLFFSKTWEPLGSKSTLVDILSTITKIPPEYLLGRLPLSHASIAQRMSWASRRATTCEEDIAYSLLGIFKVNMPLIYGEGSKAFIRLQEEITKQSNDDSILAWGLFARHPSFFANCGPLHQHTAQRHMHFHGKG
ncbi:heterokaryon incompatibility protein-domain-containing protein [Annulohypoxylon bovei var. microspora]|nr:heterokaryon incompatibility protein-domain-containing protein [Annulohypoxylon bovei var. microspora]